MNKVLLALDMDDTLCDTQNEVVLRLRRYLYEHAMWDDLMEVYRRSAINETLRTESTMLYPDHLRQIVKEEIIAPGEYVKTVKPTPLVEGRYLARLIHNLKRQLGHPNFQVVIATHRNDEKNVRENTFEWLFENKMELFIDEMHFIHGSNKIDFLKEQYPEHQICLLDDNPFGNLHITHPFNESVMIYDRLAVYDAYQHQNKFVSTGQLETHLLNLSSKELENEFR